MALPALAKTWEFAPNVVGATSIADETDCDQTLLAMKDTLTDGVTFTRPWTVVSSSDSVVADGNDNWVGTASIVHDKPGNPHSWIVLQAPTGGIQICIETGWTSSIPERMGVYWSPSAGFTGGTTSNRPTATDEQTLKGSTTNLFPSSTFNSKIQCMISTDGEQTRLFVMIAGVCLVALLVGELADTPTGLADPSFLHFDGQGSGEMLDLASIYATGSKRINDGGPATVQYSGEAIQTGNFNNAFDLFTGYPVDNAFSAEWHMGPVGVWGPSGTPQAGKVGNLPDVWWGQEVVNTGDQYPSSGTLYQFVQVGDLVFPWDSATVFETS